jgi:hypothetical protein
MDQRIYICTHKPFTPPSDSLYIPLQVGKAISDDYGYIGDDTGDNISELNRNWCELTGYYWLWKNISCDICQERFEYFVSLISYQLFLVVDIG